MPSKHQTVCIIKLGLSEETRSCADVDHPPASGMLRSLRIFASAEPINFPRVDLKGVSSEVFPLVGLSLALLIPTREGATMDRS
jgi:hypothetical protein